jgi:hypothetical protein
MGFGFGHASHLSRQPRPSSEPGQRSYSALHGALVVAVGGALIVALAFGAMLALTGPDGWLTKAANTALRGDASGVVLTAYTSSLSR